MALVSSLLTDKYLMYVNLQEHQVYVPFNVAFNDFARPVWWFFVVLKDKINLLNRTQQVYVWKSRLLFSFKVKLKWCSVTLKILCAVSSIQYYYMLDNLILLTCTCIRVYSYCNSIERVTEFVLWGGLLIVASSLLFCTAYPVK